MRPVQEEQGEPDSEVGEKEYRWKYFVVNSTRGRLIEEVIVEAAEQPR